MVEITLWTEASCTYVRRKLRCTLKIKVLSASQVTHYTFRRPLAILVTAVVKTALYS